MTNTGLRVSAWADEAARLDPATRRTALSARTTAARTLPLTSGRTGKRMNTLLRSGDERGPTGTTGWQPTVTGSLRRDCMRPAAEHQRRDSGRGRRPSVADRARGAVAPVAEPASGPVRRRGGIASLAGQPRALAGQPRAA